jgi:hypothetical protein
VKEVCVHVLTVVFACLLVPLLHFIIDMVVERGAVTTVAINQRLAVPVFARLMEVVGVVP